MRPRAPLQPAPERPSDLVAVGRVLTAFGIRGQIKILPFSPAPESVLKGQKHLWLGALAPETILYSISSIRRAGDHFVAQVDGIEDRDAALALGKPEVWVSRAQFPSSRTDEFYWVDLVGCAVINRQAERMGTVVSVDDHGAHALLGVSPSVGDPYLIPFVDAYIDRVDLALRTIFVDWQADYA